MGDLPLRFLSITLLLTLLSCANPQVPSGGPQDRTPPRIAEALPPNEAVNVDRESVEILFDEYVEAASVERAIQVTPAFEGPLRFDWSGRRLTIRFPEPLRPNTTYRLTIGTEARDVHSVRLDQPITLAFATGPRINRGQLQGRIVDARTGGTRPDIDVFAYPPAAFGDSLGRPAYVTQSGTDGRFALDYLREQPYFLLALRDQNRNRQLDRGEARALPPERFITADTSAPDSLRRWLLFRPDRTPPSITQVRPRSTTRTEVRFDEPVQITDSLWHLHLPDRDAAVPIRSLYSRHGEPEVVFLGHDPLRADEMLLRLDSGAVRDTLGQPLRDTTVTFMPTAAPDTASAQLLAVLPVEREMISGMLPEGSDPRVALSRPADSLRLREIVQMSDTAGSPLSYDVIASGATYIVRPEGAPRDGAPFLLRVLLADTTERTFRYPTRSDLGGIIGEVIAPDTVRAVVELYREGTRTPLASRLAEPGGRFHFPYVLPGSYWLRAFIDTNGDARWNGGRAVPYVPAEPIAWQTDSLRVRPRWDTELARPLKPVR